MAAKGKRSTPRQKFSLKPESGKKKIQIELTERQIADLEFYGRHAANGSSVEYVCAEIVRMTLDAEIEPAIAKLRAAESGMPIASTTAGKDKVA